MERGKKTLLEFIYSHYTAYVQYDISMSICKHIKVHLKPPHFSKCNKYVPQTSKFTVFDTPTDIDTPINA